MKIIYQLCWNGKFHQYLPFGGNAHQRRVDIRKYQRAGFDIYKFNVDTSETALHRSAIKESSK